MEVLQMQKPSLLLGSRMKLNDGILEKLSVDVRIDLSSSDRLVTQHFLDGSQICPTFYQMSGKRMSQRMYSTIWVDTSLCYCSPKYLAYTTFAILTFIRPFEEPK